MLFFGGLPLLAFGFGDVSNDEEEDEDCCGCDDDDDDDCGGLEEEEEEEEGRLRSVDSWSGSRGVEETRGVEVGSEVAKEKRFVMTLGTGEGEREWHWKQREARERAQRS